VHSYYSQLNVMRTIEQILGLPPMNQQDLTAEPMRDVFTNTPDLAPYKHLPNQVPLSETNPSKTALTTAAARSAATEPGVVTPAVARAACAAWSMRQDWTHEDRVDMGQANRDVWYASCGFARPYPGDASVLLPQQVPPTAGGSAGD